MFTKCINGLMDHSMELLASRDVHNIITQERKTCLDYPLQPKIGVKRECVITVFLKDWNNLDKDIRNAPDIVNLSV